MRRTVGPLDIGDADDARRFGDEYDRVVSVAAVCDATTHAHELRDGEHEYGEFEQAVDAVVDGIEADENVLVHCQAGMSRSVSVAIAALVATDWEFDEAYDACKCGFTEPAPELLDSAKRYAAGEPAE